MSVNKLWLFQDESGDPGKSNFFITGYIRITSEEKNKVLKKINEIREAEGFYDEFHYQKFSDFRARVYKRVIDEVLGFDMFFKCIVIRKNRVDLRRFGNESHIAYNFFTKLVMYHGLKHRDTSNVHIRVDDKSRLKKDNFLSYIKNGLNYESLVRGNQFHVKSVKPRSSHTCDMLQICDLFLGAVKCKFEPAGERKVDYSNFTLNHKAKHKIDIWDWHPY